MEWESGGRGCLRYGVKKDRIQRDGGPDMKIKGRGLVRWGGRKWRCSHGDPARLGCREGVQRDGG